MKTMYLNGVAAIILAFNLLGDELRDALDPQLSHD